MPLFSDDGVRLYSEEEKVVRCEKLTSPYCQQPNRQIPIYIQKGTILMDRTEQAKQNFKNGYNCSQAVVAAYSDLFGVDPKTAVCLAEGFGGGMGRMRLTCGAVTGMFMLVGLKYSKGEAGDIDTRTRIYETVQKMAHEFEEMNGSIICGDLLGINRPKDEGARPEERTEQYYKKRPCVDCVGDCAALVEKYLLNDE